jgi:uncharacterized membrane protein YqhA
MRVIRRWFETALWNSRFVVVLAVAASVLASLTMFYIATVDVVLLVKHVLPYADAALGEEARKALRAATVTHMVEVVDGYLLALVLLIFGLGMYELFVSEIDPARVSQNSVRILVIEDLDDLKNRLAKVILMILIVRLFEHAVSMQVSVVLDLLYFGGAIALVGLALYLSHKAEAPGSHAAVDRKPPQDAAH